MLEEMCVANAGGNVCGKCWRKCVWQMLEEMCVANARRMCAVNAEEMWWQMLEEMCAVNARRNVCGKCSKKCVRQMLE